ncbi:hypothetical protein QZH41_004663 [Actinostola sp. cb2023]|nr:hypothetical protein QZH41_004663 [Actinostola sp. cb2023]
MKSTMESTNMDQAKSLQRFIKAIKDVQSTAEKFMKSTFDVTEFKLNYLHYLHAAIEFEPSNIDGLIKSYTLRENNNRRARKFFSKLDENIYAVLRHPGYALSFTIPYSNICKAVGAISYSESLDDLKEISITKVCNDIQTCPKPGTPLYDNTLNAGSRRWLIHSMAKRRISNRWHERIYEEIVEEKNKLKKQAEEKERKKYYELPISVCTVDNKCDVKKALPMMTGIFWYQINEMIFQRLCPQNCEGGKCDYLGTFHKVLEDADRLISYAASLPSYWGMTWNNFYNDAVSGSAFTKLDVALSMVEENKENLEMSEKQCDLIKLIAACSLGDLYKQYKLIKKTQQNTDRKLKDLREYSQIDYAQMIALQKQNLQHLQLLGGIKKLDDNLQASVSGISTFFEGLAKFDQGIAQADADFLKGALETFEKNLTTVETKLTQDIKEAMTLMEVVLVGNLAEEIGELAALVATNSNPLKLIFAGPDVTQIMNQAQTVANAATKLAKGTTLYMAQDDLYKDSRKLRSAFAGNSLQISSLQSIVDKIKNGTVDDIGKDAHTFIEEYGAYTPKTTRSILAKNDALWSAFKGATCDVLNGEVGIYGGIASVIAGGKLLCERLDGTLAQFFTLRQDIYDFQFQLIDSVAAVVRGNIAQRFAKNIKGKHDVLEASQFMTGFFIMQSKIQKVSSVYCDVLEYKNLGKPVTKACSTVNGLFRKENIDALIIHEDKTLDEYETDVYIPTRAQSDGDTGVVDLQALARGETVIFQIPVDKNWLTEYGWISPGQRSIPFIKSLKLFLPHKTYEDSSAQRYTTTHVTMTSISGSSVSTMNPNTRVVYLLPKGQNTYRTVYDEGYASCSTEINNPYSLCNNLPKICDKMKRVPGKSLLPTILSTWSLKVNIHQGPKELSYDAPTPGTNLLLRAKAILKVPYNAKKKSQVPKLLQRSNVVKSPDGCCYDNKYRISYYFPTGRWVVEGFKKLSVEIQKKLQSASEFAKATVDELKQVPQDVLCALKESISGMTSSQFKGLVKRFTTFTAQNLRNLASSIKLQSFFDNINDLTGQDWDPEQLAALMKAAFRKFGKDVKAWGKDAFATLKQLIAGLESGELMQMAADSFKEFTNYLCSTKLNDDQKKALLVPAKKAYGDVSEWDDIVIGKLCDLIQALPIEEVLRLSGKVVSKAISVISKAGKFTYPHARALLDKVKSVAGGDLSKWSADDIKKLGKLLKDLDVEDLKKLLTKQFKDVASTLGDIDWSPGRARKLAQKAIESLGEPAKWTADNLKELKNIAGGLLPSELKQLVNKALKDGLKAFKNVQLEIDQAQEIVNKVKDELQDKLENLDEDDLIALTHALDGFLASDIGKLTQLVVYAAFPELKIAKEVAIPIIRELIEMHKKDASGKNDFTRLGEVAVGLSRSELDDEDISTYINNLDKVGVIPWDKTQIIEIAKKVRDKWGSINETDISDSDTPNWGFLNLKKLGRVALGIAKEELRDLPIRGIEDSVDVLGRQKDWERGQVAMVLIRLREYWVMENLDFSNFTELDINSLGSFVQGLTTTELKRLPNRVLLIAIRRLGDATGIPEDRLRARAFTAVEYFKNQSGIDILNATHIQDMGNLVAGLGTSALNKISQDAFVQNLYTIARSKGFDEDKLKQLAKLAKKHFKQSDVGKWATNQWRDLGPAIKGLTPSDLRRISRKALEEVMDDIKNIEFSKDQAQALVRAAKDAYGESDIGKWTGDQLRQLGSLAKGLSTSDIMSVTKEAFEDAVGVWGKALDLDLDNLKAMATKAKEFLVNNDASKFTAAHLKRLGRVVLGLQPSDLEKLKLDSVDVIAALGKWKGWTEDQIKVLKPKIKEFLTKNSGSIEYLYMSLGELGTALSKVDISQIPSKSFKLAVKQLGELNGWTEEQLKALLDKTKKEWSQAVEAWDKAQVSELGFLQKGLSSSDIPKLDTKVVDAIKPAVIGSMSTKQLQSFTPAQYSAMETPQVAAISMSKRSLLSTDQRSAIQSVTDTDPIEDDPWQSEAVQSDAYHVTVSLLSMMGLLVTAMYINY